LSHGVANPEFTKSLFACGEVHDGGAPQLRNDELVSALRVLGALY
jgi:hypothetical protein